MAEMRERRRHPRVATCLAASLRWGATLLPGTVIDISRGGARVILPTRGPVPRRGQGVVLAGEGPLRHGLEARVIGQGPGGLRLAFDPSLTAAVFFDPVARLAEAAIDAA